MRIVPVIDLKAGHVVRAVAGERAAYQPLATSLAHGTSEPAEVVAALWRAFPGFRSLYIADLDAIEGRPASFDLFEQISAAVPDVRLMIDCGLRSELDLSLFEGRRLMQPVIGSETVQDDADIREMSRFLPQGCALSLDMRGERRLGPDVLFDHPELWPDEVIAMSLDRVGTSHGPDFGRLGRVCDQAGGRTVFAAGGVRGFTDLAEIGALGCAALVSSVLHNGGLNRAQWDRLCDL